MSDKSKKESQVDGHWIANFESSGSLAQMVNISTRNMVEFLNQAHIQPSVLIADVDRNRIGYATSRTKAILQLYRDSVAARRKSADSAAVA